MLAVPIMSVILCATTPDVGRLLDAIQAVETGGMADPSAAVGDQGRSLGPYQIMRGYWQDAQPYLPVAQRGRPYQDVRDRDYARQVVIAYWRRYCPRALAAGDWQTLARCHNSGPRYQKRMKATDGYWRKVKRFL